MKFTIQNADLQSLITAATAVSKSPDPIKIIAERIGDVPDETPFDTEERPAEAGQIRVIAFNGSMVAEWRRPAEIRMTGSIAIHADGLDRLIKVSRNSDSTFALETIDTDNERSLRLSTSRSAHEFPGVSDEVFDTLSPGHTGGKRANLQNLANAINIAKIAAAAKGDAAGGRIMLTGVHIRKRDDIFDVVGTDVKRLALATLKQSDVGGLELGDNDAGVTIPPEAISLITEMLNEPESRLEVIGNNIIVECRNGSLSVRAIDAPYPNYSALLELSPETTILLPKSPFEMALQRSSVTLARDKRSVAVKLSHGSDGIYITSSAAGGSSSECISDEPGDDVAIGFDPKYMSNAISAFDDSEIRMDFSDERIPIRITSKNHPAIKMLVMPCKVT